MKKLLWYLFIVTTCLFLLGCQQSPSENRGEPRSPINGDKSGKNNSSQKDIFDFKHIDKAPKATEKHPINEVIKVFLDEWSFDYPYEAIAIDIENNEVYVNPIIGIRGLRADNGIVQINDAEKILEILEKYDVQSWEEDYTFEDPKTYLDGYSWGLLLQFKDGTVEKHTGRGTDVERLTPENFEAFFTELTEFVKDRLDEQDNDKKEKNEMYEYDIYDFVFIKKAPEATKKHSVSKVIKILFNKGSMSAEDTIAIDVLNNEIYINPEIGSRGLRFSDGTVQVNDIEQVLKVLEKYDVQTWKNDYTFENPDSYQDGFGWNLRLQFEDGTVAMYGGEGAKESEITPDNFDAFSTELNEFVEEKIGKN